MMKKLLAASTALGIGAAALLTAVPSYAVHPYGDPLFLLNGIPQTIDTFVAGAITGDMSASLAGVVCDGQTDNTTAFGRLFAAAQALPWGVHVVLPAGVCRTASLPAITVPADLTVSGHATNIVLTTGGTDGLVFTLSNAASLRVEHLTISRAAGAMDTGASWPTNRFQGRGVWVQPASGGQNATDNGGQVQITDVHVIAGPTEIAANNSGQGWAVGIGGDDLHTPEFDNNRVFNAPTLETATAGDTALAATIPTPGSSVTSTPANMGPGVASDFLFEGIGTFATDASFKSNVANGGLVGYDIGDLVQGVYGVNNRAAYNSVGLRAEGASSPELVNWANGLFDDGIAGVELNGYNESAISDNLFIHETFFASPHWTGVWLRNAAWTSVTGNNVVGLFSASPQAETGIQLDTPGLPVTVTGNTVRAIAGVCIEIPASATDASVTGNTTQECSGSNIYEGNFSATVLGNRTDTGRISDDGLGDLAVSGVGTFGGSGTFGTLPANFAAFFSGTAPANYGHDLLEANLMGTGQVFAVPFNTAAWDLYGFHTSGVPPVLTATGDAAFGWNANSGGEMDFIDVKASGNGGWQFDAGSPTAPVAQVDYTGNGTFKTTRTPPTTAANLPACGASLEGTRAAVTDATSATFGATLAGGGSNHEPVYCAGASGWVIE